MVKVNISTILLLFSFLIFLKVNDTESYLKVYKLFPVGKINKKGDSTFVEIFAKYSEALRGLDGFSHVIIIYWFDKNDVPEKRSILQVHPRGNKINPLTGVFACRAPVRPNLIALSICRNLSVNGNIISVDKIDAFDGSPVLDIKPYMPDIVNHQEHIRIPNWLED